MEKGIAHAQFLPDHSRFCGRDFSSIPGVSSVQVLLQQRPMKLSPQRNFFPVRLTSRPHFRTPQKIPPTGVTKGYLGSSSFLRRIVNSIPMLISIAKVQQKCTAQASIVLFSPQPYFPLLRRHFLRDGSYYGPYLLTRPTVGKNTRSRSPERAMCPNHKCLCLHDPCLRTSWARALLISCPRSHRSR